MSPTLTSRTAPVAPAAPAGVARLSAALDAPPGGPPALPRPDVRGLVDLLQEAGLTGRGGGGFPTARKLAAVADAGRRPVVVANGVEGEPLSRKDALLLTRAPEAVLDGLEVVAGALRARRRVVAVGEGIDPGPLQAAVRARGGAGVEVRPLAGGFVGGQESAVVRALNGGPSLPTDPHTPVWARGVDGRPTLVLNAETLAHVGQLARWGAAWFREVGTAADPGTFLSTVSGSRPGLVAHPGVLEVARGTSLRGVLRAAGTEEDRVTAVLVGGYHGAWVRHLDLRLTSEVGVPDAVRVGAGVLHVLDVDDCPLRATADVLAHLADAGAGQCGPCVNGLPRLAGTMRRLARPGADPALVGEITRLRGLLVGRGACAHPDGTARLALSALAVFGGHVEAHLRGTCR